MRVANSTFSGNSTLGRGGALFFNDGHQPVLTNVTIVDNVADADDDDTERDGGGIYTSNSGTLDMSNTLIAHNRDGSLTVTPSDCETDGNIISLGYNFIQDPTGCENDLVDTDIINQDPFLIPTLQLLTRGAIALYYTPQPGSPVIDQGNPATPNDSDAARCRTLDQLAALRPIDGDHDLVARCDIGSIEIQVAGE